MCCLSSFGHELTGRVLRRSAIGENQHCCTWTPTARQLATLGYGPSVLRSCVFWKLASLLWKLVSRLGSLTFAFWDLGPQIGSWTLALEVGLLLWRLASCSPLGSIAQTQRSVDALCWQASWCTRAGHLGTWQSSSSSSSRPPCFRRQRRLRWRPPAWVLWGRSRWRRDRRMRKRGRGTPV